LHTQIGQKNRSKEIQRQQFYRITISPGLVLAVRIAPTVGDYCGLIFEKEDDDDQPTTTKTKSIKKVKILG
jgi:hypothetical protein